MQTVQNFLQCAQKSWQHSQKLLQTVQNFCKKFLSSLQNFLEILADCSECVRISEQPEFLNDLQEFMSNLSKNF